MRLLLLSLLAILVIGCAAPTPVPTSTPVSFPTSTPRPTVIEAEKSRRNTFPTLSPMQRRVVCLDLKMTVQEAPSSITPSVMRPYLVREFNLTSEKELEALLKQCRIRLEGR